MIGAVIFDFGNVLCRFDPARIVENFAPYSTLPIEELRTFILTPWPLAALYESGAISSEEFFHKVVDSCRLRITRTQFIHAFSDIFTPIPESFALVKRLHGRIRLGLLSNTSEWHFLYGIKPIEVFPLFDAVTLSYQVGAMKPDPAIYRDMLTKLNLPAADCFYTDDLTPFVEAARALGLHAATFTTAEALREELSRQGVRIV